MPYTSPFLRLVVIGDVYKSDIFNFGINFAPDVLAPPPVAPLVIPEAVEDAVVDYFQTPGLISIYAVVRTLKLNLIDEDGRYANESTVLTEVEPTFGGVSTTRPAPQISLAISTTTAVKRGRAHSGRWFMPLPGGQPDSDGRLDAAYANSATAAAVGLLTELNAALPGWKASVMSSLGATHSITGVRVGRVLDTMRSRRSGFVEDYSEAPLTP